MVIVVVLEEKSQLQKFMVEMPSKRSLNTMKILEKLTDHTDKFYLWSLYFTLFIIYQKKRIINVKKGKEKTQQPPSQVTVLMLMRVICHDHSNTTRQISLSWTNH